MSDPQRWQADQAPYATPSFPAQPPVYRPYDQTQTTPLPLPLPQLRPLQPNPYPTAGHAMYPFPRNSSSSSQLGESDTDKSDNRRTRISRAWYENQFLSFIKVLMIKKNQRRM